MKYLIHTCPERLRYVKLYLYPSMLQQGIKDPDIIIDVDEEKKGVLQSYLRTFKELDGRGTWHIQDDVILSSSFKKSSDTIEKRKHDLIVCGICTYYDFWQDTGLVTPERMWYSFPLIYIPDKIAHEFCDWTQETQDKKAREKIISGKGVDALFKAFLMEKHEDMNVINSYPNLCDHIDYLIGGTTLGTQRNSRCTALFWNEQDKTKALKERLLLDRYY